MKLFVHNWLIIGSVYFVFGENGCRKEMRVSRPKRRGEKAIQEV